MSVTMSVSFFQRETLSLLYQTEACLLFILVGEVLYYTNIPEKVTPMKNTVNASVSQMCQYESSRENCFQTHPMAWMNLKVFKYFPSIVQHILTDGIIFMYCLFLLDNLPDGILRQKQIFLFQYILQVCCTKKLFKLTLQTDVSQNDLLAWKK